MSKEEIKNRFKKTKLGKKIFKRYSMSLVIFIITHVIMLISFVVFASSITNILLGVIKFKEIFFGMLLLLSAILSFVFGFLTIYYDGKIVGCVELFELMLKAKVKANDNE